MDDYRVAHHGPIGYQRYDAAGLTPAFPFGHGLSYASFGLGRFAVEARTDPIGHQPAGVEGGVVVRAVVTNTSTRRGRTVVQVYAGLPPAAGEPPRRLVGWAAVELDRGEERELEIAVPARRLAAWSATAGRWQLWVGSYEISAGWSSRDLAVTATVDLPGRLLAPLSELKAQTTPR